MEFIVCWIGSTFNVTHYNSIKTISLNVIKILFTPSSCLDYYICLLLLCVLYYVMVMLIDYLKTKKVPVFIWKSVDKNSWIKNG